MTETKQDVFNDLLDAYGDAIAGGGQGDNGNPAEYRLRYAVASDGDTDKPLQGVEFTLYDSDDKEVAKGTTDKYGVVKFTHLKEGKYYVVETKALPGYVSDTTKNFFEIARP